MAEQLSSNAKELVKRGDKLFGNKESFNSLCQTLADNFYPERANFTTELSLGEEFATHLFDGTPSLMRRDLGNAISSMLRPTGQPWFEHDLRDERIKKAPGAKEQLQFNTKVHRNALYAQTSKFVRVTKETDHDWVTFGNGVISCEENERRDGLIFNNHHLKGCAWADNADGVTDTMFRDFMMAARQMRQRWGEKALHAKVKTACEKEPDTEFKVRHVMLPVADYEYETRKRAPKGAKFVSVYIDTAHSHLISEAPSFEFRYVVPRWQTVSGSPYAVSPAAIIALPDARMIQALARIIQEAGEKAIDPPMKATEEAVRGEINLYASGITWVDKEYDERLGPALEPIQLGHNVGLGVDLLVRTGMMLRDEWFISKLVLPQQGVKTAYETQILVEEYIRQSAPLFEPAVSDYIVPLLDLSAKILRRVGAFGDLDARTVQELDENGGYEFSNPLQDAIEKAKIYQFQNVAGLAGAAVQADPGVLQDWDVRKSFRDAVAGSGAPAEWLRDKEEADEAIEAATQAQQVSQVANIAGTAGAAAEAVGKGGLAIKAMAA